MDFAVSAASTVTVLPDHAHAMLMVLKIHRHQPPMSMADQLTDSTRVMQVCVAMLAHMVIVLRLLARVHKISRTE